MSPKKGTISQTHQRETIFLKRTSDKRTSLFCRDTFREIKCNLNGRMSVHAQSFQNNTSCVVYDKMQTDLKSRKAVKALLDQPVHCLAV